MTDSSHNDPMLASYANETVTTTQFDDGLNQDTGVHFLTDHEEIVSNNECDKEEVKETPKGKTDVLEYFLQADGSVICKVCGEVLQSRTHWYRHKYKRHVTQPLNPTPLFQCKQCLVFFKSRKGYIGHIASRHSELLSDSSPVLSNTQVEAIQKNPSNTQVAPVVKEEHDPESVIPKSSVPNYQMSVLKQAPKASEQPKKNYRGKELIVNQADWEKKRSREDKLVRDIIDRVRRECEGLPSASGPARRNYGRRTTIMQTDTFS